ncbi:MAG TPA: hypothetical protein VF530_22290 [Planctomycetota bacterium]
MKKLFAVAALAALSIPALAGGDKCLVSSYRCENACPLAQKANTHRSFGTEAFVASKVARADLSGAVVANLARI